MAQREERILKNWQDYIEDYEQKLNSQSFDLSTANGRRDHAMMEAHLQSLRSKFAYLQQYYTDNGELPENITFEAMEGGAGAYRTEQGGEIKPITLMGGGNGGLTVSAPDFSGAYHWTGPEELIASGYEDTSSSPYKYGIEITGPAGAGYISMEVSGTLFVGMTSTYHFHYESLPSTWTVQLNLNNTIPVYDWTSSQYGMNGYTFNGGVAWSLDEMTVPTDEPWDYYEEEIKPNIDPSNDIFPDGYEPPGPGNDPDDGPEEELAPDKTDWGEPDKLWEDFNPSTDFNNYAAFNAIGLDYLKNILWDSPDGFWDALSILGSNSANYLDYLVSLRVYPYKINVDGDFDTLFLGRGGELSLPGTEGSPTHYGVPQKVSVFPFEIEAEKHYNNFLDFAPYTKAELYLPFSGVWEINPKYVYHTRLKVILSLDITDGSGIWEVYNVAHEKRVLVKQCKVGIEMPLSGNNAISQSSQIVSATLGLAQTITGGVPKITNSVLSAVSTGMDNKASKLDKIGAGVGAVGQVASTGLDIFSAATNLANANREMPCYTGGTTGLAAAQIALIPSLTLIRPVVENPSSFPHTVGHLVNQASKLKDLNGFTTCRNVDMSNVSWATDREKAELKTILENGFYA